MQMAYTILPSVARVLFFHTVIDAFRWEYNERKKICVWIFSTTFVWNMCYSKTQWARYNHNCILAFMYSSRCSRQILTKLEFSQHFSKKKILKYPEFVKIRSMRAELIHADGETQTGSKHDEANSCFSLFCLRACKLTTRFENRNAIPPLSIT
jgi:hypothetical protein